METIKLKRSLWHLKNHFSIYQHNKLILRAVSENVRTIASFTYQIIDEHNRKQVTIKHELKNKKSLYHILKDNEILVTIATSTGLISKGFSIKSLNIKTETRKRHLIHTVYQGDKIIGEIEVQTFRIGEEYHIKLPEESSEYVYILICMALAIHHEEPTLMRSVFNKYWGRF